MNKRTVKSEVQGQVINSVSLHMLPGTKRTPFDLGFEMHLRNEYPSFGTLHLSILRGTK